jgi:hypothetical protein
MGQVLSYLHSWRYHLAFGTFIPQFAHMRFFFASGAFFPQFVELCVTSYPSPLEQAGPLDAKLFLFAVAGVLEYAAASWTADLICGLVALVSFLIHSAPFELPLDIGGHLLALFLCGSFALRARSFTRDATRAGRGLTVRGALAALVWHNPALACHVAYCCTANLLGSASRRIQVPDVFWVLVAPTLEIGELHMDSNQMLKAKRENGGNQASFTSILVKACLIGLINTVVRNGPGFLIHITLFAQSHVFYRTAATIRQQVWQQIIKNEKDPKEANKSQRELIWQKYLAEAPSDTWCG